MRFLDRVLDIFLEFLFPKSRQVLELEKLSSGKLLQILPQAEDTKDENIIALFDYKFPLTRDMIWEVKYGGNKIVAEKLGEILFDTIEHELSERGLFEKFEEPTLMPMPISDKRRFERGWNQAELLCDAIKKCDTENILKYRPRQLVKHWHTESQTRTATKAERLENIKNSMKVLSPQVVEGKCIILVDDVTTTGATFLEAKRALKQAGAKKVLCIAVAH